MAPQQHTKRSVKAICARLAVRVCAWSGLLLRLLHDEPVNHTTSEILTVIDVMGNLVALRACCVHRRALALGLYCETEFLAAGRRCEKLSHTARHAQRGLLHVRDQESHMSIMAVRKCTQCSNISSRENQDQPDV
jgi:hypothetical protein